MAEKRRVVVTGMGVLTPIGLGVSAFWDNLLAGTSGADYITRFDASGFRTQFACEIKGLDPSLHIPKKELRKLDLFSIYAIIAAQEAIEDAGITKDNVDPSRVGVIVGSGIGGLQTFEEEMRNYFREFVFAEGKEDRKIPFSPFFIPKMIIDIAAGHISMIHGFTGPNFSCVSACATSAHCIGEGMLMIQAGLADVMVVGGSEAAVTPAGIGGFNAMKALSERNDDPKTASRPFDKDRDGFVLGEGAGVLVLESLESAQRRNARIYAEMGGFGYSCDAYHLTAPHPEGAGAIAVMKKAVEMSGLNLTDVDHINMHGTSTPLGDIAETKAIKQLFGEHAYKLNLNSTKSMTGHLLGAAGAVEAVAAILAIYHDTIPPTINHFTDDPECDLNYTFHQPVRRTVNVALSNTFGFGGHNVSLLFKKLNF